jgi:NitT/TauT family transport system substrate-binding protein
MPLATRRSFAAAVLAALGTALAAPAHAQAPAGALEDVKFSLDFIPLGRFAPWYFALGKGYYKQEGLNVTISTGRGSADGIRMIESGVSDIGFVDVPSLIASGDATSVKVVAITYQRAPYCVFSLNPGANVTSPRDMVGLELGSSSASFVPRIHQAFMRMHRLDASTLKVTNIDAPARVALLVARKVPAIDLYVMSEPGIRRAVKDAEVKCMLLADHGLNLYGSGLGAKEDYLKRNPDTVRKFVRASMRAWRDALANPQEAATVMIQYVKALDPQIIVEELEIVKRLSVVPDTQRNGFGWFSREGMEQTVNMINANADVTGRKLAAAEVYREGFLPQEPIRP